MTSIDYKLLLLILSRQSIIISTIILSYDMNHVTERGGEVRAVLIVSHPYLYWTDYNSSCARMCFKKSVSRFL